MSISYDEALQKFGKALGDLKRSYANEFSENSNYLSILIDESNNITIIPTLNTGRYIECCREYVNVD